MNNAAAAPRRPSKARKSAGAAPPNERPFPIVGIGASAGGLEALELFLRQIPKNCGLAFVVVQHLAPTHKPMMVQLLQRGTSLQVMQIKDRMRVETDHVYVIPPNCDLSILHGVLHILEPAAPRGLRLPIDFFFRALADDRQDQSLGVILSGMGSDGTLGLRAIKEKAGAVFVQDPDSAKFDAMPRSAIEAGLADVVAPAEELYARIVAYLQHGPMSSTNADVEAPRKDQDGIEKVIVLLRAQTGHDFSHYKNSTLSRRIERRMGLHHLARIADYIRYLRENPTEGELLFNELLIGVTRFFRDPGVWEHLKNEVIPSLLKARTTGGTLRAWVPGCSTGEEAFSLAIVFKEAVEKLQSPHHFSLQIFATDLDQDAINKARAGTYPLNIAADVSEDRLARFFVQDERGYRVAKEIRETVIFASQNMVMDPPFTRLDILTCRNLLIYLTPELQRKLLPLFHYSLNPGGILFLGTAETIGSAAELFAPCADKMSLYRRLDAEAPPDHLEFPSVFARAKSGVAGTASPKSQVPPNMQMLADRMLLANFAPAAVLAGEHGDILYVSGKTGKYLEPVAGKANWNLLAMAREGLGDALTQGFRRALRGKETVTLDDLTVKTDGGRQNVRISIQPLAEPDALKGTVMVVFVDLPTPQAAKSRAKHARTARNSGAAARTQELEQTRADLMAARDEVKSSQEELRSSNEELQSTNEELQSLNEELTTSKEELQSMNEELQTLNHELQVNLDELTLASSDMTNLLNSTSIATLFLDSALRVRRFTTQTASIIKLIPSDVGRPITDIVSDLDYLEMARDSQEVLRTLVTKEREVSATNGRWFAAVIKPYRTHDDRVDGLVLTFSDITKSKMLEAALRKTQSTLEVQIAQQIGDLDQARAEHQQNSSREAASMPVRDREPSISMTSEVSI